MAAENTDVPFAERLGVLKYDRVGLEYHCRLVLQEGWAFARFRDATSSFK